jgi:cell division protein FtsB
MTKKQMIPLSVTILILVSLLFFILFSEHGLTDLNILQKEKTQLIIENQALDQQNRALSSEIDRLKHDPEYIESIARQELGMVGEDEVILKPKN